MEYPTIRSKYMKKTKKKSEKVEIGSLNESERSFEAKTHSKEEKKGGPNYSIYVMLASLGATSLVLNLMCITCSLSLPCKLYFNSSCGPFLIFFNSKLNI